MQCAQCPHSWTPQLFRCPYDDDIMSRFNAAVSMHAVRAAPAQQDSSIVCCRYDDDIISRFNAAVSVHAVRAAPAHAMTLFDLRCLKTRGSLSFISVRCHRAVNDKRFAFRD